MRNFGETHEKFTKFYDGLSKKLEEERIKGLKLPDLKAVAREYIDSNL